MKTILWSALALLLIAAPVLAQTEDQEAKESQEEHGAEAVVRTPPAPYAQWLVDQTVATHASVSGMEMAVVLDDTCRTIAATDKEDLGEICDDELEVMTKQEPEVEEPSDEEPVYEVTLALHDAQGKVIGSLGMDLDAGDLNHDSALALARKVLQEVEAKIPAKGSLFKDAPSKKKN